MCKIIDKHREVDLINVIPDRMRNFPVMSRVENFLLTSRCYHRGVYREFLSIQWHNDFCLFTTAKRFGNEPNLPD